MTEKLSCGARIRVHVTVLVLFSKLLQCSNGIHNSKRVIFRVKMDYPFQITLSDDETYDLLTSFH